MNLIVSSIVGGVNEHNSIVNSVGVDDWTTEGETIASNDYPFLSNTLVFTMKANSQEFAPFPKKYAQAMSQSFMTH